MSCHRRFKVQLKRLTKISHSLFFSAALAGNIYIKALGHKSITLAPDCSRKRAFHSSILSSGARKTLVEKQFHRAARLPILTAKP